LAFQISDFKMNLQANPLTTFADLMSEFSRGKSLELSQLRAERDAERRDKLEAMREIERLQRDTERREAATRQKVCLLINSKKAKIAELKARLDEYEKGMPKPQLVER